MSKRPAETQLTPEEL
jgi:hypothetical protein